MIEFDSVLLKKYWIRFIFLTTSWAQQDTRVRTKAKLHETSALVSKEVKVHLNLILFVNNTAFSDYNPAMWKVLLKLTRSQRIITGLCSFPSLFQLIGSNRLLSASPSLFLT